MNALRLRPLAQQVARQQRTKSTMASKAFPPRNKSGFKKAWLSDPSTYPIIAVMGGGFALLVGMTCNALFTYKQGIDISPNKRGSIMKDYSSEYRVGVMERFVKANGGVNPEGLGIDHDEWTKNKELSRK